MTGRAAGYCAGYAVPGFANPAPGAGAAWGPGMPVAYGRGMAWRRGRGGWGPSAAGYPAAYAAAAPSPGDEKTVLEAQITALRMQLDRLAQRLASLADRPQETEE